ncbi:MAG: helix-turn-helix domain-containing protein [Desulfovibrio sp.]
MSKENVAFTRVPDLPEVGFVRASGICGENPFHGHESLCVGVVLDGKRTITLHNDNDDPEELVLRAGNCFLLSPGQLHSCAHMVASDYLVLNFDQQLLYKWGIPDLRSGPIYFTNGFGLILDLVDKLESLENLDERIEAIIAFFNCLVVNNEDAVRDACLKTNSSTHPKNLYLEEARQYLLANYTKKVSLTQAAAVAHLSMYQFCRNFARAFGLPPHAYMTLLRVNKAKKLLKEGLTIAEIAQECGFSDQSHLIRHFRRIVGMVPSAYRNG